MKPIFPAGTGLVLAFTTLLTTAHAQEAVEPTMYIQEFRVQRAKQLPRLAVEEAVYPFLGPGRKLADVDQARAALEKVYRDKGYQTAVVEVPQQSGKNGIIFLQVTEGAVGRLRVNGAKWFVPSEIRRKAPSMEEGRVPNFNDITRDIVALNQWPDRQVTPDIRPGVEPGTVDIDLNVKDRLPLHGSLELNNRHSPGTTSLRINGGISYNNLWQEGHALGLNFQIAPERLKDAQVLSAYYLARLRGTDKVSLLFSGTKQDSDVSTLGGAAVAGRGEILGARALFTLPQHEGFFQSLSFGMDYKHFRENLLIGDDLTETPITYYPWNLAYGATWTGKKYTTEANGALNFHLRGMGSDSAEFDAKRYKANGGFFYLRGDLSHTRELSGGAQFFAKVQGQLAGQPLINSEQFAAGGLGSVRGYEESAALGDDALFATVELRSPSLIRTADTKAKDWRAYAFLEGGRVTLTDALPGQKDHFDLLGAGLGTRFRFANHFNGSLDAAWPLLRLTDENGVTLTFRLWTDF